MTQGATSSPNGQVREFDLPRIERAVREILAAIGGRGPAGGQQSGGQGSGSGGDR